MLEHNQINVLSSLAPFYVTEKRGFQLQNFASLTRYRSEWLWLQLLPHATPEATPEAVNLDTVFQYTLHTWPWNEVHVGLASVQV